MALPDIIEIQHVRRITKPAPAVTLVGTTGVRIPAIVKGTEVDTEVLLAHDLELGKKKLRETENAIDISCSGREGFGERPAVLLRGCS